MSGTDDASSGRCTDTVAELYAKGRVLAAAALLQEAVGKEAVAEKELVGKEAVAEKEPVGHEAVAEKEPAIGVHAEHNLLHAAILKEAEQVGVALEALEERLTWRCARDEDGMLAHIKSEGGVLSLCFETTYDVPAAWLLAFAREWDLMSAWNKYTSNTEILSIPHLLHALVYGELWLPWPLSNRSVMFTARGVDLLDEKGCVLALFDSQHNPFAATAAPAASASASGGEVDVGSAVEESSVGSSGGGSETEDWMAAPATDSCCVRADVHAPSCLRMVPLPPREEGGAPRTRATMLVVCDPKVMGVPDALLSFVFGIVTPWVDRELKSQFLEFGKEENMYAKRIAANRALYGLTDDRCAAFLQAQQQRKVEEEQMAQ